VIGRIVEDEAGGVVLVERARAEIGPEIDLLSELQPLQIEGERRRAERRGIIGPSVGRG
jgi:hypothetical protein